MAEKCCSAGRVRLLFPCAGGSDVGELTDKAARALTREGWGRIYCLAGVAAHLPVFLETTKMASEIVALDGCPAACASKTLIHAGFQPVVVNLKDAGFLKGETPVSGKNISCLCQVVKKEKEAANGGKEVGTKQVVTCCCSGSRGAHSSGREGQTRSGTAGNRRSPAGKRTQ
ncbi:MAG TPA: putative zinc-binding protein [bacterium]|nr:putative zinc-binding protein [bacterium]